MKLAPIAFFAYKRPELTHQALQSLSECRLADKSVLFIFCDGPKTCEDREGVENVRKIVTSRKWCHEVNIIVRENNYGLARSVIDGVTSLCEKFGKIIVLEDDLVLAKGFLDYMNRSLTTFESCERVLQISGHRYPFTRYHDNGKAFFMPVTNSWGWGTWNRAWSLFDTQAVGWEHLELDSKLRRKFDQYSVNPFSTMLIRQMSGKLDSWAIRWSWSVFMHNGLCLYPDQSLVKNIGFGEGATHTTEYKRNLVELSWDSERETCDLPEHVEADLKELIMFKRYIKSTTSLREKLARLLGRLKKVSLCRNKQ